GRGRSRTGTPGSRGFRYRERFGSEDGAQQRGAAEAVGEAMVRLAGEREAAVRQTFDQPDLPKRPRAAERLREDPRNGFFEMAGRSRSRQCNCTNMIFDAKVRRIDPYRVTFERNAKDALAVAWNQRKSGFDVRA